MSGNGPLADPIAEAERVAVAAKAAGIGIRLLGGAGIHLHSPSATRPPLKRKYGDLDYVIAKRDRQGVLKLFPALGYEANDRFNLMQGDRRLYFFDATHGRRWTSSSTGSRCRTSSTCVTVSTATARAPARRISC